MEYIVNGFKEAFLLLFEGDAEMIQIIVLSLFVSCSATILASTVGVPMGLFMGIKRFPLKKLFGSVIYTMMGFPPVVIGLLVVIFLSRKGPLGRYELLFTPQAMMIAQFLLVFPIVVGIMFGSAKDRGKVVLELAYTLGANRRESLKLLIHELNGSVLLAVMTAFGRAISEVGAVMLVGGNIKGQTRVMTTFIAMNNSMGAYERSIAMAIVLLSISLLINSVVHHLAGGKVNGG